MDIAIISICVSIASFVLSIAITVHNYLKERRNKITFQANNISAWIGSRKKGCNITLMNNTSTPVYNVVITIVFVQGTGPKDGKSVPSSWRYRYISPILPPEQHSCFIDFAGVYGMHARFGVEIAFTDCLNRNWVRSAQGKLIQIKCSPYTYYSLCAPYKLKDLVPN